jgi:glycosyltransferase involved in cell wall biosynthesis
VVGSGWRFTSGLSYYTCRLATALNALNAVSVVLMRRLIPVRFYPGRDRVGVPLAQLQYPSDMPVYDGVDWYWGGSLVGALRFLRHQRPDVLVLQWWTGAVLHTYLVLSVVARLSGARTIIEFHEVQDTGETRLPLAARYLQALGSCVVALSAGVVVHSTFDEAEIRARFRLRGRHLAVIAHGPYDHVATEPVSRSDRTTCNVLFFGTIRPYKGLEHLVAAFNSLDPEQVAPLQLTVVGETWEQWTEPLELIASSPHADRITLVNRYVSDEEVAAFFADADAVVLPYLRSSASGPLHIAMACGLPVVLSDVGGLREAADGYSGVVFVPPGDVEALRAQLLALPARAGTRHADPQSWERTAAAYDRLFDEVMPAQ